MEKTVKSLKQFQTVNDSERQDALQSTSNFKLNQQLVPENKII